MASPDTQNVVVNSQSVDDTSSIDVYAKQPNSTSASHGAFNPSSTPPPTNLSGKLDTNGVTQARSSSSLSGNIHLEGQANGQNLSADHLSLADTASVQGSFADVDSTRDANSVADPFDPSVGSDTDTSRADIGEQLKDGSGLRSAKKLTSFKAVSVTKNFLAKTASASVAAKAGDKTIPTIGISQPLARPRLVAKSGSGLRDSPRTRSGADSPADGSTVWNKNRPAPPPPTKHFTDEELKQQYGIHLASRIQADDSNKQSKWADIDDDEDDWAPETVEWMDGTKSTINPEPLPNINAKDATAAKDARPLETKPILTALKRPQATGPPKTVLRPGAAQQAKQDLANSKESQEPNSLTGPKAHAPVPTKSPWATLPPIDKSAPIADFDALHAPAAKPTLGSQDARMMDGSFHNSIAREMEADTFDRAWRETDRGPRELFNSQSGRYEPAPEGRRGSMRREQGYRQPSVLQRPSQSDGSDVAIEPYQARGAQMDGSPWTRRRGSSISAHSAQPFERRISISQKGPDSSSPAENRTGIVIGHDIGPQAKQSSPKQAQKIQQQVDDRNEEILRQKRIMQEKRELAIRRRKEEEEKEEAERRERIRLKLESLGLEPLPDKSQASVSPAQRSTSGEALQQPTKVENIAEPTTSSLANEELRISPVKAQSLSMSNTHSDPGIAGNQISPQKAMVSPAHTAPPRGGHEAAQSRGQEVDSSRGQEVGSSRGVSSYSSPGDSKVQPVYKSPGLSADTFATWGHRSGPANAPNPNVWGPPGALRHIGNGAFDSSFSRIPPRMQNQNIDLGQNTGFIAPGQSARSPSSGTRQETSPMRHQQMLSDQNLAALGLVDTPNETFAPVASAGPSPAQVPLSPIAPPPRYQKPAPVSEHRGPSAWTQFATQSDVVRRPFDPAVRQAGHLDDGQAPQQRWKETFKQTKVQGDWNGARRELVAAQETVHGARASADSPAPPVTHTQQPAAAPIAGAHPRQSTVRLPEASPTPLMAASARGSASTPSVNATSGQHQSRFFPTSLLGGSPPPEEASHPVHSGGDRDRPTVNLPTPKPHVRLPPAVIAAMPPTQPSPVIMPERAPSYRNGPQPLVQSSDWQARFNGLFGRVQTTTATPPSPPKTPPKAAAVPSPAPLSSSKAEVFDIGSGHSATVSLPTRPVSAPSSAGVSVDMASKPTFDDIFDGELSFGSTPKVSVPRSPLYQPENPERSGLHILRMRPIAKFDKPVEPLSRQSDETPASRSISIHLPFSGTGSHKIHMKRSSSATKVERKASHPAKMPRSSKPVKNRQPSAKVQATS
ncbi:hypothetical protein K461DRAFT_321538 [Myriangium duriaei CBS 260.36]|uniref:Uncharacterized protein n=1 Tax=Myriangium duriaei CBS 260.36 TaxID=1168546 RepID=A0A9P4MFM1_9PEZI|nr:hypothetical protein K461DRAFT_321538 [Myriangium duriaei CBS 260.36]